MELEEKVGLVPQNSSTVLPTAISTRPKTVTTLNNVSRPQTSQTTQRLNDQGVDGDITNFKLKYSRGKKPLTSRNGSEARLAIPKDVIPLIFIYFLAPSSSI
jgi:hypothetical protein